MFLGKSCNHVGRSRGIIKHLGVSQMVHACQGSRHKHIDNLICFGGEKGFNDTLMYRECLNDLWTYNVKTKIWDQ